MDEAALAVLPELQERFEALEAELENERNAVAEIAEGDQDELKEYRAAIAEQAWVSHPSPILHSTLSSQCPDLRLHSGVDWFICQVGRSRSQAGGIVSASKRA